MTHRILLREVVIDAPADRFDAVARFWSAALLTQARPVTGFPEFTGLPDPAALCHVGLQDVGEGSAGLHLDVETDDIPAELARLTALGATELFRHGDWVVLADPAGTRFCLLPPESDEFDVQARTVPG